MLNYRFLLKKLTQLISISAETYWKKYYGRNWQIKSSSNFEIIDQFLRAATKKLFKGNPINLSSKMEKILQERVIIKWMNIMSYMK